MRKAVLFALLTAFALTGAATTHAHHAVQAQFDVTKNLILSGTLKKVDWTNPHAWFHFDVKAQDGVLQNALRNAALRDRPLLRERKRSEQYQDYR